MNQFITCGLSIILLTHTLTSQGIEFSELDFSQAIEKASNENRPIFIDVYTTWCGPCKRMEKNVFSNEAVGDFFNKSFINLRMDAEDPAGGIEFSKKFKIQAFPTLLFLSARGAEIDRVVGAKNKGSFLKIGREMWMFSHDDLSENLQHKIIDSAENLDQIKILLERYQNISFLGKYVLASSFLHSLDSSELTLDNVKLVGSEISQMNSGELRHIISYLDKSRSKMFTFDSLSMLKMEWTNRLEDRIKEIVDQTIDEGDKEGFENLINLYASVPGAQNFRMSGEKEIEKMRLKFYRENDNEKYAEFAEEMIKTYILPFSPEKTQTSDESNYKWSHSEIAKKMMKQSMKRLGMDEELPEEKYEGVTSHLDSLQVVYRVSKQIGDRLYQISQDFYQFYETHERLVVAEKWAALSYEYFPYDLDYYENHKKILTHLQMVKAEITVDSIIRSLPFMKEMLYLQEKRNAAKE